MAGSTAPVMYWARRATLCSALRWGCQAIAIPGGDAASRDTLNGAAVELLEDLRNHAKSFQPPEGGEALLCSLHDCVSNSYSHSLHRIIQHRQT